MNFRQLSIGAALGIAIGLVLGAILRGQPRPTAPVSTARPAVVAALPGNRDDETAMQLTALRDQMALERETLVAIAEELDQLWEEIGVLSANASAARDAANPDAAANASKSAGTRSRQDQWIDAAAMVAAGMSPTDAARLREMYEAQQLDELYLRDQASREGWISSSRFRSEMGALREALRTELGDEDYDWVMWASGRKNRVEVDDVLQNSAAEAAGIQKGDILVSYGGELMMSPRELRRATLQGRIGDSIAIDVLRGGERIRFYVPAGPLGTRLGTASRQPDN
jgi:membrane-associated protease RseP (regulator of RpoE activity)